MAYALMRTMITNPDRLVIALVGAYHASEHPIGRPYDATTPLLNYVRSGFATLVVGFESTGGTAWVCLRPKLDIDAVECGAHPAPSGRIVLNADRIVPLRRLTASPPAVAQ